MANEMAATMDRVVKQGAWRIPGKRWIRWVEPEVGIPAWECPECGKIQAGTFVPERCFCCGCVPLDAGVHGFVRGEERGDG